MSRKRLAITVAASLAGTIGLATVAYTQTPPRTRAEYQQQIEQQLGITSAQKDKLKQIETRYKPQEEAVGNKYRPRVEALQRQMQALQQQYFQELKPILEKKNKEAEAVFTPAQRAKMKDMQAQQMKRMQEMQRMQGSGKP